MQDQEFRQNISNYSKLDEMFNQLKEKTSAKNLQENQSDKKNKEMARIHCYSTWSNAKKKKKAKLS